MNLGAAVQWHNNVISAARSRKRGTASATPTTSPSGAGTSTCVRCTPRLADRESASAYARPACAAEKSLKPNLSTAQEGASGQRPPEIVPPSVPPRGVRLLHGDQLHVENQGGVRRDLWLMAVFAVSQAGRDA